MLSITGPEISDFSRREFAKRFDVSEKTIARRCAEGALAHYRIGRQVRIPYSELIRVQRDGLPLPTGAHDDVA